MITCHARRTHPGGPWVGYIRCTDGPSRWTESTKIRCLTRGDALANASWLRTQYLLTHHTTEETTP